MLTLFMEEVEREADLGRVESRVLLRQSPLSLHVEHQVTAVHKLYHEEQPETTENRWCNFKLLLFVNCSKTNSLKQSQN